MADWKAILAVQWHWILEHWKEAFYPANWSNWSLVIVGSIAGYLAWRTLQGIEKQAGIMREQSNHMATQTLAIAESVKVSKRQADLMENSERARMNLLISRLGNFSFDFSARNIGRTSARVNYARGFIAFLGRAETLPDIPHYLEAESIINEPVQWIGADMDLPLVRQDDEGRCEPALIAELRCDAKQYSALRQ